ncbi:uncharacterized protein LOC128190538 isoform X2 [Crassostrea angulata]|uniref:uncharacterized protein LOC128190538 isoform X2 n=1 Tax=Magallana angulata TaxID=2784310 RepID=UPI0022B1511A|nr:uncharacterized protein LOC128190538 isoform X2 [Crassostrea angulata]
MISDIIRGVVVWLVMVNSVDAISNVGPTCFQCDREALPTTCSNVVTCGPHEVCSIEKGLDLLDDVVFWSGCKSKTECSVSRKRSSPADVTVTCSECCDGNFCNANGCGYPGFPAGGNNLCFNCVHMKSPSNCSHVATCQKDEVCYFEELQQAQGVSFHSGCRSLTDCKVHQMCGGCCLGDFCNSGCSPYDNLRPLYQYVTLTNAPGYMWITIPYHQ